MEGYIIYTIEDIRREYQRLDKLTGISTDDIEIAVSSRSVSRYGSCRYIKDSKSGKYTVQRVIIAAHVLGDKKQFWETIRHEYAHVLVMIRDPKKLHGHDDVWKAACMEVGCPPERTAEISDDAKALRQERAKYIVRCNGCGKESFFLKKGAVIKALESGKRVMCRFCGKSDFSLMVRQ